MTVLFACVHNAGRSQMAAAFFNALADPTKVSAISAGTEPAEAVHPEVVGSQATLLVTMGCGQTCPVVRGVQREDWELPDPKGQSPDRVRAIRDEIRARVELLVAAQRWQGSER